MMYHNNIRVGLKNPNDGFQSLMGAGEYPPKPLPLREVILLIR